MSDMFFAFFPSKQEHTENNMTVNTRNIKKGNYHLQTKQVLQGRKKLVPKVGKRLVFEPR